MLNIELLPWFELPRRPEVVMSDDNQLWRGVAVVREGWKKERRKSGAECDAYTGLGEHFV
jgi:hypothetical protein